MDRPTILTDRFDRALLYATHVHGGQIRKSLSFKTSPSAELMPCKARKSSKASAHPELENSQDSKRTKTVQDCANLLPSKILLWDRQSQRRDVAEPSILLLPQLAPPQLAALETGTY